MAVTIEQIKELRQETGAGVSMVKEALEFSKGDKEKAMQYLREKGVLKSSKRSEKVASNGVIGIYFHINKKFLVSVEVLCETDFAAKTKDLIEFANKVALNIAAYNPLYISVQDVPEADIEKEKSIFYSELEGKPEDVKENIIKGKLNKFYSENVLLLQPLINSENITVQDYLNEIVAKIGEKVIISRFVVIKHGGEIYTAETSVK